MQCPCSQPLSKSKIKDEALCENSSRLKGLAGSWMHLSYLKTLWLRLLSLAFQLIPKAKQKSINKEQLFLTRYWKTGIAHDHLIQNNSIAFKCMTKKCCLIIYHLIYFIPLFSLWSFINYSFIKFFH